MEPTLFQRIINREIPATIEFEDDEIIAIRDIAPSAPVHILIIPKKRIENVDAMDAHDAAVVGRVFLVAKELARSKGIAESGYRVVTNCNHNGGQTVPHLHFHLLGGAALGPMNSGGTSRGTSPQRGLLFDAGVIVLASIVLAVLFNAENPKGISWLKKEFAVATATTDDISAYLPNSNSAANNGGTPTTTPEQPQPQQPLQPTAKPVAENGPTSVQTNIKPATPSSDNTNGTTPATAKSFTPQPGVVKEVTHDMFVRLMAAAPYYLIDARGADKYAQGHIANAVNFYGAEVQSRIPDVLANVPRDRIILIYCDGGECELSHHVADVLKQFQYGPIFIYTGGWAEWISKH